MANVQTPRASNRRPMPCLCAHASDPEPHKTTLYFAQAAITGGGAGAATALGALRNAEVPLGDETVQKLQEILGLPPGYEAAEDKPGALEAKDGSAEDIAGKEAAGAAKGQEGGIADGAEGGDEELPELDVYEEGAVEGPTKAKRRKGKKGKKKKQNLS